LGAGGRGARARRGPVEDAVGLGRAVRVSARSWGGPPGAAPPLSRFRAGGLACRWGWWSRGRR